MLLETIKTEIVEALKSGDSRKQQALKFLVSESQYIAEPGKPVSDEEMVKLLQREAKKRREAMDIFGKAGEAGRVDQEQYELALIEKYLPKMMGEDEVSAVVDDVAAGGKRGGQLVGEVMAKLRGKADGGMVSKIVMEKYR